MKVQCNHCGKKYTLPAERVAGRILKIRCRQCSNLFEVDGSQVVLTEPVPSQEIVSPPNHSDSGVSAQLQTQEFSAIDLANQVGQSSTSIDTAQTLPTAQATSSSPQSPHHQPNVNQLSVEVSQSAQEWMASVMSDVDRPITREIKLNEITGHRSLPPESRSSNLIWLSAIVVLLGLGYLITQISGPIREKPKVLTLRLSTNPSLVKETAELNEPAQTNRQLDPSAQSIEDKVSTESKTIQKSKETTAKRITPLKKKKETKAQFKDLNQALDDLKKSSLTASTSAKIEVEGNLNSDRKQASKSSNLSKKKSNKKSKSKASQTAKSTKNKKAKQANSKKLKTTVKSKQTKRSKPSKSSRKKTVSKKNGKGLDYSTISTIMNQNAGGLENCYRKALKKDSSFGAVRTRLKFRVSPQGRVARKTISLSGVYRRTRLESCIQNTVVRWYFPKAKGETPVKYPLTFTPGF